MTQYNKSQMFMRIYLIFLAGLKYYVRIDECSNNFVQCTFN
jgi:hypothetical protein